METNNKLREALIKARSAICHFARLQCQSLSCENGNIQANCADVLCSYRGLCEAKTAINAALAEQVKNYEVGTAEEQEDRFRRYCNSHGTFCGDCQLYDNRRGECRFAWSQMPYEEGGGDADK